MNCPSCGQEFWTGDALESHWEACHQPAEGDLVLEGLACPGCGERRMDRLNWLPPHFDQAVKCQRCGQVYEP